MRTSSAATECRAAAAATAERRPRRRPSHADPRPALGRGAVTGPAVPVTRDGQDPSAGPSALVGHRPRRCLIAALTILARMLGLVRTIVFAKTVGATCLGTAYITANTLPNIVYDIALGGALTSIMVPVLARPAQRSADRSGRGGRGPADVVGAADLDDPHPRAGQPGDRAGGGSAGEPAQPGEQPGALRAGAAGDGDRATCWRCSRRRSCCTAWPSCCTEYCRRTAGSRRLRWRRSSPASSSSSPTWPSCRSARRT